MTGIEKLRVVFSVIIGAMILSSAVNAKPGAPVAIQGPQAYVMDAFSNKNIHLLIRVPKLSGQLRLSVSPDDELSLIAGENSYSFELQGVMDTVLLPLSVSSTREGKFYIMLNAELISEEGRSRARSMGISVTVGSPTPVSRLRVKPEGKGEKLKLLPATENIY